MMLKAARGYVTRLGFDLVVAGADKVPLARFFPRGASSATHDLHQIERALRWDAEATLACRIGQHLVLDVDVRHDGPASLARLLDHFGELPPTWTQQTPTGGLHVWFKAPGFRPKGQLAKGVEVLTGNRLVTLSPSARAGGRYCWLQHPLRVPHAEAPRWLLDAVREPEPPKRMPRDGVQDEGTRERRARAYLQLFDPAVSGQQGHARTFLAAQIVTRGFDLEGDCAFAVLNEWNQRCDPPWSDRELRRKLQSAAQRGRMPVGALLDGERRAA